MKGSKCKCKYATTSIRRACPRCGKVMTPAEWPDEGTVLSVERLQVIPEGLSDNYNLALVGIEKGPKLVCWTKDPLKERDSVSIVERDGKYFCAPKRDIESELEEEELKA